MQLHALCCALCFFWSYALFTKAILQAQIIVKMLQAADLNHVVQYLHHEYVFEVIEVHGFCDVVKCPQVQGL